MKISFEGQEWEFELEKIDLQQAIAIQLAYGFNLNDWFAALEQADARALQCLYWLMLQQRGDVKPIKEVNAPIMALADAFNQAYEASQADPAEPEPEPVPTTSPGGPPSPAPPSRPATTPPPAEVEAVTPATV